MNLTGKGGIVTGSSMGIGAAVVPEKAQALLSRFDRTSTHYEVILEPD